MISKSSYSGLKYSPYASPFLIKEMCMNSIQTKDKSEFQNKNLNNSLFSLSLLSPAPGEKDTPLTHYKMNREMEISGRRLFQSPIS